MLGFDELLCGPGNRLDVPGGGAMTALATHSTYLACSKRARLAVTGQTPQFKCGTQDAAEFVFAIGGMRLVKAGRKDQSARVRERVAGLNESGAREGEAVEAIQTKQETDAVALASDHFFDRLC